MVRVQHRPRLGRLYEVVAFGGLRVFCVEHCAFGLIEMKVFMNEIAKSTLAVLVPFPGETLPGHR